jgi:hypothetical protein
VLWVRSVSPADIKRLAIAGIVSELATHGQRPPDFVLQSLAGHAERYVRESLPPARLERDDTVQDSLRFVCRLLASAYLAPSLAKPPPVEGWPRGPGRRQRLGALGLRLTEAAMLAEPLTDSLPAAARTRIGDLGRAAVVRLAKTDPLPGSREQAPELVRRLVLSATSAYISAQQLGSQQRKSKP